MRPDLQRLARCRRILTPAARDVSNRVTAYGTASPLLSIDKYNLGRSNSLMYCSEIEL